MPMLLVHFEIFMVILRQRNSALKIIFVALIQNEDSKYEWILTQNNGCRCFFIEVIKELSVYFDVNVGHFRKPTSKSQIPVVRDVFARVWIIYPVKLIYALVYCDVECEKRPLVSIEF